MHHDGEGIFTRPHSRCNIVDIVALFRRPAADRPLSQPLSIEEEHIAAVSRYVEFSNAADFIGVELMPKCLIAVFLFWLAVSPNP